MPLALTDNLNFGNPHKPENFLQLREAVEGMAEACRAFGTPVTGGNVSLYNESPAAAIDPTPTVGVVGIIADSKHITTSAFKHAGDVILLLGELGDEMGASHYLKVVHGMKAGPPPRLDYKTEIALHDALRSLIRQGLVQSAHDCSEGGLAVTLAESCLAAEGSPLGARIGLGATNLRADIALFNESQSRVVISVAPAGLSATLAALEQQGIPARQLGEVIAADTLDITADGKSFSWPLAELHTAWADTIGRLMEG